MSAHTIFDTLAEVGAVCPTCLNDDEFTQCCQCLGVWCDRCDPAHGPLCPWCHGMGYSTAAIVQPVYRQANHVLNNDGRPIATSF